MTFPETSKDHTMSANIHATLSALVVPVKDLQLYGRNPRRGDVDAIMDSLQRNGQYKPIVVRQGTNEVLAGNHTLKAALRLKWEVIAATYVAVTDDEAARIVLVDNRTNDLAGYDETALAELLQEVPTLEGTGFDQAALDDLLYGVEQEAAEATDSADTIPDVVPTIALEGDVFELGPHRVICGDATDADVISRLMEGQRAAAMWTDPPYGVDYEGKTSEALTISNDGAGTLEELLRGAFRVAFRFLQPGAPVYVAHADTKRIVFEESMLRAGFVVRQNLVWVKNTLVVGHSDYHYKHEPILEAAAGEAPAPEPTTGATASASPTGEDAPEPEGKAHEPLLYGFKPKGKGQGRLGRGGNSGWFGTNNRTTVLEFPKPAASRDHPTMKPVKLILALMANSVRPTTTVLDPFAGSGSTLIAAHIHGAIARVAELDPHYVDVICARFETETGITPIRNGEPVSFTGATPTAAKGK